VLAEQHQIISQSPDVQTPAPPKVLFVFVAHWTLLKASQT
jgi:hypothetical protein